MSLTEEQAEIVKAFVDGQMLSCRLWVSRGKTEANMAIEVYDALRAALAEQSAEIERLKRALPKDK